MSAATGPVVVVGGGVVGLCTAYYLAAAGLPVEVVERRQLGSGASRGNAGWVSRRAPGDRPRPGARQRLRGHRPRHAGSHPGPGHRLAEFVVTGRRPEALVPFRFERLRR
ncbi:FAD-dependent oxidoreductase [Streptomyces hawaiiensis]|uniref:FAD dependent oxidoreductase domain-containing protein n=1 Tax=Streptomyces hawaiiensis TaxID=67305 RepID=A0A6G5RMJ7_9ACTN|nr:FAD-dependent oxidoreductase [Streptomyces hawaiiensis]QCD59293.1 hypothetical protein CEB94_34210 [Streptomyces hawaiiensis]